jgi:hypothetical protein
MSPLSPDDGSPARCDLFWLWGWMLLALIALTWLTRPPFVAGRIAAAGE